MSAATAQRTRRQRYLFLLALRGGSDAEKLRELLDSVVAEREIFRVDIIVLPQQSSVLEEAWRAINAANRDIYVLVTEDSYELGDVIAGLPRNVLIYVGRQWTNPLYNGRIPSRVREFPARNYRDFAARIIADFGDAKASSNDALFSERDARYVLARTETYKIGTLNVRTPEEPSLLSQLSEMDLTRDELVEIALLENDPEAAALLGSWFDSKRQVALTIAGGCLAGAIAAFIGDATVVGTSHGIFSGVPEKDAVISLTTLTGVCIVSGAYYLNKVRTLAKKSVRVQHFFNRKRRSP